MFETLESRILWILEKKGWTQRELARRAHLSGGTIGALLTRLRREPNGTIDTQTAVKIAEATGVTQEWLTAGKGAPEPSTSSTAHGELVPLAELHGWEEKLALAKADRPDGIPESFYDLAGQVTAERDAQLTVNAIHKAAEFRFVIASKRKEPKPSESDPSPPSGRTRSTPPGPAEPSRPHTVHGRRPVK